MGSTAQLDVCQNPAFLPADEINKYAAPLLDMTPEFVFIPFRGKPTLPVENPQILLPVNF